MKETLKKGEIMKDMGNSEEIKMVFWMLEFVNLYVFALAFHES